MSLRQLIRTDLNLLVALRVLLEERNVTRAAERLFISQPAMSKTLQRLREAFDDALFTRTAYGLIPTPRAESLQREMPQLLDQLGQLIHEETFIPAQHAGSYHIASAESIAQLMFPSMVKRACKEAPGIHLKSQEIQSHFLEQLANGELDFAFHLMRDYSEDYLVDEIMSAPSLCLMRKGHPLSLAKRDGHKMTMKDYLSYPHVRLYIPHITAGDIGIVDELMARSGKQRQISFETSQITPALEVLSETDCLMVAPEAFTGMSFNGNEFVGLPLPSAIQFPPTRIALIQHKRTTSNPAHQWLRELILNSMT